MISLAHRPHGKAEEGAARAFLLRRAGPVSAAAPFASSAEAQRKRLHRKVALVGKAGCGKSTAITLVQRFYDVVSGSISLDGHPLASYDLHHLRAHTGVVAQENILFSATIRENICYGMGANGLPEPTDEMVAAACEAANAHEFIAEFPQGLSTLMVRNFD